MIDAVGNRERAAYLSGVDSRRVTLPCFTLAGACSGAAGLLPTGSSNKACQAMGGTNILGGRGPYLGTVVGVVLVDGRGRRNSD